MADGDRKSGRSARADQIVATARLLLEREGPEALTMRRLGEELGIRAPSLYKHLASKKAIEVALIEEAFRDIGAALHAALEGRDDPVDATRNLLATYRRFSLAQPNLYRLATAGRLPREDLAPGLEDWAGEPFLLATGDPDGSRSTSPTVSSPGSPGWGSASGEAGSSRSRAARAASPGGPPSTS